MRSIVVDTGFLIGLFDEADPLHRRCRAFLRDYRGRFLTTEAVLAEAFALLSLHQRFRLLEWLASASHAGLLEIERELLDFRAIERLLRKYSNLPMDFADASLVLLATRTGIREILTADERDFSVYRLGNRTRFIDVLAR